MRSLKQFLYSGFFLIILALIVWWIVGLVYTPNPTCFDNRKNQNETGVDCGGPCISCEIKSLKPVSVSNKYIIPLPDGIGIAVELVNQNADWGASSFVYTVTLKDQFGNSLGSFSGNSFIYGGELKYIVVPRVQVVGSSVASIEMDIQDPQWMPAMQFQKPDIEIQDLRTTDNQGIIVSANVYNKDARSFQNTQILALVFNRSGALIGASQTVIDSLSALEIKNVRVLFPKNLDLYQPIIAPTISLSKTLAQDDTGTDVKNLQSILAEQGFYTGAISGFFDQDTAGALQQFQSENNIEPTGELNETTRVFINNLLQSETPQQTAPVKDTSVDATKTKVFINAKR
jgi:hypothetical protein